MKSPLLLLLNAFAPAFLFAQGIPVSQSVQKKNVVIEQFSGMNSPWDPTGDRIAEEIADDYPGDVFIISIETGGYAEPMGVDPDYRTPFGPPIANQSGLTGYPSATVNRHIFPQLDPSATALNAGPAWRTAATQIMTEDGVANLGIEATIDVQTRQLNVHVQVYYTGDPPSTINKLSVAILQENIIGPQIISTSITPYPGTVLPDGNYVHKHMLRHMLTAALGDNISPALAGATIDKYYSYTVGSDFYGIPIELSDLRIAAFVAEGSQEIITGHVISPTFVNFASANDASVTAVDAGGDPLCGFSASPAVTLQNFGSQPLTSLIIDYSINGGTPINYNWSGLILPIHSQKITLPDINFSSQPSNTLIASTRLPNGMTDGNASNDYKTVTFSQAPDVGNIIVMDLQPDQYGSEITWELVNSSGAILYSGGPYTDMTQPPLITETFNLPSGDCYKFLVYDSYGDGIIGTNAGFTLTDNNNFTIVSNLRAYGKKEEVAFGVDPPQHSVPCSGRYYDKIFPGFFDWSSFPIPTGLPAPLVYGNAVDYQGNNQVLDMYLFQPQGDTALKRPLVILAFGGSFLSGAKESPDVLALCDEFVRRGYVTASIKYRLGVDPVDSVNMLKAIIRGVQDARAAVRFFYKDAATVNAYKIDTNKIFFGGVSSGAMVGIHYGYLSSSDNVPLWINQTIASIGGLEGNSGNAGYSSKVHGIINLAGGIIDTSWMNIGEPPMVSMHGDDDGTVPYCTDVLEVAGNTLFSVSGSGSIKPRASHVGVSNPFFTWKGGGHVDFTGYFTFQSQYKPLVDTTIWFIRDFLNNQMKGEDCGQSLAALGSPAFLCALNVPVSGRIVSEPGSGISLSVQPNPFSNATEIIFTLQREAPASIIIYDILGKEVMRMSGNFAAGSHRVAWNGNDASGHPLDAGLYHLRMISKTGSAGAKMVLTR